MSSFSIKGISQLNLSLNIDNKKNIQNIQIIINDLKELIDILSFRISDVSISTQQQIAQNDQEVEQQLESIVNDQEVEQQLESIVNDATIPDFTDGTGGDGGDTNAVVGYFD